MSLEKCTYVINEYPRDQWRSYDFFRGGGMDKLNLEFGFPFITIELWF